MSVCVYWVEFILYLTSDLLMAQLRIRTGGLLKMFEFQKFDKKIKLTILKIFTIIFSPIPEDNSMC